MSIKIKIVFLIFLLVLYQQTNAQISTKELPYTFRTHLKYAGDISSIVLRELSTDSLLTSDSLMHINNRFAVLEYLNIDLKDKGTRFQVRDSITIWQHKIKIPNAKAIGVRFGNFYIPEKAKLFLYNSQHTRILGAYTHINNKPEGIFAIQPLEGDEVIIEYEEPLKVSFEGTVIIQSVAKVYKDLTTVIQYNDINCSGWENWQTTKRAICRIIFDDYDGSYYCTGSLINNARFDATPYFLTANHCINNNLSAASVIVYFNYETNACNGIVTNTHQTLSGSLLCANAAETDFSLLKLLENPPDDYKPFFAGWDVSGDAPLESSVIHHPKGLNKSIAYSNKKGRIYPYVINWDDGSNTPKYTHWEVEFTNGNTNSGSSGSPLLNSEQLIIGQLHGGDNTINYYGALHVSWNLGALPSKQLKYWLDPDNTGVKKILGTDGKVIPIANFALLPTQPCTNAPVLLSDSSINGVKNWKWIITPNSFQFLPDNNQQQTNDSSRNPVVAFFENNEYTIKLIVSNNFGKDSLIKKITPGSIQTEFVNYPFEKNLCGKDIKNLLFEASGAYLFDFNFDTQRFYSDIINNKLYLTQKDTDINNTSYETSIRVTAYHGECIYSDSIKIVVQNIANDKVKNALPLNLGINGPFDNTCATYEEGEPHPPTGGCSVPDNWCYNAENTLNVVNRSLWFTFIAPATGKINILSQGLDTRMAIYKSNSAYDLLASKYQIIAANDNTSKGNNAFLNNVSVVPGEKYWLQVDANNNSFGSFTINLYSSNLEIIPNPAHEKVKIIFPVNVSQQGTLSIIALNGQLKWQQTIFFSPENNEITLDCISFLSGIYLVKFSSEDQTFISKMLIIHP